MADDDEFEDLFSFGDTTTPGGTAAVTTSSAADNQSSTSPSGSSDFDLLLSNDGAGSGVGAGTAATKTPRSSSSGVEDEFDALFGTPPPINNTPGAGKGEKQLTSVEKDSLLAIDELPDADGRRKNNNQPLSSSSSNFDDFHVHDEDTRDMLDWLDDDHTGKKGVAAVTKDDSSFSDINSTVSGDDAGDSNIAKNTTATGLFDDDDDDFDFDQMLADVGVESTTTTTVSAPTPQTTQKSLETTVAIETTKKDEQIITTTVETESKDKPQASTEETETQSPLEEKTITKPDAAEIVETVNLLDEEEKPIIESKTSLSAGIEEELAFDKWEDDDDDNEEEIEDLQTNDLQEGSTNVAAKEGEATQSSLGGTTELKPPAPPKITFSSLSDAIRSNASTAVDVRSLFSREVGHHNITGGNIGVKDEDRPYLWTKVICGKTLGDVEDGSLADSFREWEKKGEATAKFEGEECSALFDSLLEQCGVKKEDDGYEIKKQQLISLSYFHSRNKSSTSPLLDGIDSLIPPVALALLQAGISCAAASVVLSQIEPSAMPLLRLGNGERYMAAKALHVEFYLLACYHLPLLIMHLDRHCPGWYWPRKGKLEADEKQVDDNNANSTDDTTTTKGKSDKQKGEDKKVADGQASESTKKKSYLLEQNGLIPLSWFVTNFAGECGGSCLDHSVLLQLWDNILTKDGKGGYPWKYFLSIAVLEKKSDILLMSRGDELKKELEKIVDFEEDAASSESFVGANEATATFGDDVASEWLSSAKSLMESTPSSVIDLLRSADDRSVTNALKARQAIVDKELQTELDAHETALKKEREERDKEAERALNKARLTAYYRTHNPEKVDTIDAILKLFDGRMGVLNEKLKKKVCCTVYHSVLYLSLYVHIILTPSSDNTVRQRLLTR